MEFRIALAALAVAVTLGACSDNDSAIFYSLENEVKEVDYSLPNESHVLGMGKMNGSYYVSLGGSIWTRAVDANDWDRMSLPPGHEACTALADFADLIYAGTPEGLATWDGAQWASLPDPLLDGAQIVSFFVVGQALFACAFEAGEYLLAWTVDGVSFAAALSGLSAAVAQVAWDGAVYYAVAGSTAYRGTSGPGSLAVYDAISSLTAATFAGITWHASSQRYLATTAGQRVYSSDPGNDGAWDSATADESSDVTFTRLAAFGGYALVGSTEHGFFMLANGDVTSLERWDHSTSSDLYGAFVRDWYIDPDDTSRIFALTAGSGLWRTSDPGSSWIRE
jgi:hypothetical protein